MNSWEPPVDLTRLLDALAEDIIAASDLDVHWAGCGNGWPGAARETREAIDRLRDLVAVALDAPDGNSRLHLAELLSSVELRQRIH